MLPDAPPLLALDCAGTTWRFWRVGAHFFGRSDGHPLHFLACFLDHDGGLWRSWNGDTPSEARERLRVTVSNEGYFRVVEPGDGERVLLHRAGAFAQNASGELARCELRGARWSSTRFLLQTPTDELNQALKRERKRSASDLGAAFAWLAANPNERMFFGLEWTTGDGATLKRLVHAGFWSTPELWSEYDEIPYVLSAPPGAEFAAETSFVNPRLLPSVRFRAVSPRLARLLQRIVARNRPFLPRGVRLNREIGTGPLAQRETSKIGVIRFVIQAPNAHEQLEARLELRDWLRDEAPELLEEWN